MMHVAVSPYNKAEHRFVTDYATVNFECVVRSYEQIITQESVDTGDKISLRVLYLYLVTGECVPVQSSNRLRKLLSVDDLQREKREAGKQHG